MGASGFFRGRPGRRFGVPAESDKEAPAGFVDHETPSYLLDGFEEVSSPALDRRGAERFMEGAKPPALRASPGIHKKEEGLADVRLT